MLYIWWNLKAEIYLHIIFFHNRKRFNHMRWIFSTHASCRKLQGWAAREACFFCKTQSAVVFSRSLRSVNSRLFDLAYLSTRQEFLSFDLIICRYSGRSILLNLNSCCHFVLFIRRKKSFVVLFVDITIMNLSWKLIFTRRPYRLRE